MNSRNDPNRQTSNRLEPLDPAKAKTLYWESSRDSLAERSMQLHEKHVTSFVEWCERE